MARPSAADLGGSALSRAPAVARIGLLVGRPDPARRSDIPPDAAARAHGSTEAAGRRSGTVHTDLP